jgi:3-oxoacyl-ACP reductase-like protein
MDYDPLANAGKQAAPKKAAATPAPAPAPAAAAASSAAAEDNQPLTAEIVATMTTEAKEKRAKNVKKKLKQIEEIKTRKQSGAALNADQVWYHRLN